MAISIHPSRSCLLPFYTILIFPLLNRKIFHLLVIICNSYYHMTSCGNTCLITQVGMTALYIASWKGHEAVVKLLLQQHADVSICKKV